MPAADLLSCIQVLFCVLPFGAPVVVRFVDSVTRNVLSHRVNSSGQRLPVTARLWPQPVNVGRRDPEYIHATLSLQETDAIPVDTSRATVWVHVLAFQCTAPLQMESMLPMSTRAQRRVWAVDISELATGIDPAMIRPGFIESTFSHSDNDEHSQSQ